MVKVLPLGCILFSPQSINHNSVEVMGVMISAAVDGVCSQGRISTMEEGFE